MTYTDTTQPPRWRLVAAFAAIYLVWGSTYLFIRFAVQTIPPYLMAGTRFLVSGTILYLVMRGRGEAAPSRAHWKSTAIVGALLLFGGNGSVTWAEQSVPSGLAALLVSLVPLWMVLLDWLRRGGVRPRGGVFVGLALGFAGLVILIGPGQITGDSHINLVGVVVLIFASLSWATGSLYSRHTPMPSSPLLSTSMEMLAGGALLFTMGVLTGEPARVNLSRISPLSIFALGYLIVFGAFVAFSAYVWLLRVSTPARVSTYAFVNPVVAVFLGWVLGGEPLTLTTILAAATIIAGVAVITLNQTKLKPPDSENLPVPVAEGVTAE